MAVCLLERPRQNRFLERLDVWSTFGQFYGLRLVMLRFESVPLSGMMFLLRLDVHLKSVYVLRSLFLLLVEVFLPLLWLPGVYTEVFAIRADLPEEWI